MNENEYYIIKMSNGEYLSFYPQDSDDYIEGYTVENPFDSIGHTFDEIKEILLYFKEGKKMSGTSYGEVITDVFDIHMEDKTLHPVSYTKVVSRLDEEIKV